MSGPTGASPHQDAEPQKGAVLGIERREPQPQFGDPFAGLRAPQGVPAPSCSPPLHALFSPHLILDISENHQNILTSAPSTVLSKDAGSYGKLIELHQQIDKTTTRLGSAALLRDILIPPASIEQILQRRAAIEELRENAELREEVRKALHSVHEVQYHGFSCEELALRFFVPDKADRWAETAS
ncbi:MAG: MutS domain, partial [Pseudomonadota bacterium]